MLEHRHEADGHPVDLPVREEAGPGGGSPARAPATSPRSRAGLEAALDDRGDQVPLVHETPVGRAGGRAHLALTVATDVLCPAGAPQDPRPPVRPGPGRPTPLVHHRPLDDVEPRGLHAPDGRHDLHIRRQPGPPHQAGLPLGAGGPPPRHPLRHQPAVPAGHGPVRHRPVRPRPVGDPCRGLHRLSPARLRPPLGP